MSAGLTPLLLLLATTIQATETAALRERAVDYLSVRDELPLFGLVTRHDGRNPSIIVVQREWLRKNRPARYKLHRMQETDRLRQQRSQLLQRIAAWRQERRTDKDLVEFLDEQRALLSAEADSPDEDALQFMILEVPAAQVRRVRRAVPEQRVVAWVAYREHLQDVETRSAKSLLAELARKGVTRPQKPVDLSDRVPARGDSELQWAARQAVIEQVLRDPVKMKGTPTFVTRDSGAADGANAEQLLAKMMQQRLSGLIDELTSPNPATGGNQPAPWVSQAVAEARRNNSRAVHVTLVVPDASMKTATVEAKLLARMPDQSWRVIWQDTQRTPVTAQEDVEDQIREDKQIAALLNSLEQLGQADAVKTAVRFGAATMESARLSEAAWANWRDRFFEDLRTPPVVVH